jgi:hypothetical protein
MTWSIPAPPPRAVLRKPEAALRHRLRQAGRPASWSTAFVTEVSQDLWILFPWDTEAQFSVPLVKRDGHDLVYDHEHFSQLELPDRRSSGRRAHRRAAGGVPATGITPAAAGDRSRAFGPADDQMRELLSGAGLAVAVFDGVQPKSDRSATWRRASPLFAPASMTASSPWVADRRSIPGR